MAAALVAADELGQSVQARVRHGTVRREQLERGLRKASHGVRGLRVHIVATMQTSMHESLLGVSDDRPSSPRAPSGRLALFLV